MDINELLEIVKKKITSSVNIESILVEDKTFLHKNHIGHQLDKFHIKITIKSKDLENNSKIENYKIIHKVLEDQIKKYIHSIQLKIN